MNSINLTRIDDSEAVSEYYKQLRTNIYFCGQDKQCIALTSCFPNEGKSTVAFNLCKALAERTATCHPSGCGSEKIRSL